MRQANNPNLQRSCGSRPVLVGLKVTEEDARAAGVNTDSLNIDAGGGNGFTFIVQGPIDCIRVLCIICVPTFGKAGGIDLEEARLLLDGNASTGTGREPLPIN